MLSPRSVNQDAAAGARVTDICVIGGGPAGSTIAHRLASFGHDVCLIERDVRPRPHIGASLPATILPLLDVIGARDRVENAGFLRPECIVVSWSEGRPSIRPLPGPPGFHVDRREFDRLLLENAKANGVAVLQPAQALRPERLNGSGWRIRFHYEGKLQAIVAPFLVDASGGGNLLPGRRLRVSAPLLALYAEWAIAEAGTEGRVEAGENEWLWYAPVGRGKSVVAVFMDPKRLSGIARENIATTYHDLLARFRLFRADPDRMAGPVAACDASSRFAELTAGPDFLRVGDSCLSLDPLSSQGVQTAVASGLQAAAVVNTLARHPANAEAAIEFYRGRQQERVRQHGSKAATFYRERATICDRPFWRQRAVFDGPTTAPSFEREKLESDRRIQVSRLATIQNMPALQGDIIASAPVLCHEILDRPVAFLGRVELVPLVRNIRSGQTAEAIVNAWPTRLPIELRSKILHWLWERRIVVPLDDFTR